MSTIREIVNANAGESVDAVVEALMAREEEKVGTLLTIAVTKFGVEPIFAVKAFMDLELGEPKTAEMRAHVNNEFAQKVAEYQQRAAEHDEGTEPPSEEDEGNTNEGDQPGEGQE